MIVIVALVRDIQSNIERFLDLNLRNGADGILLVLDAGADPVQIPTQHQPYTVVVRLDSDWWGRPGPPPLNGRQRIVANMARVVCARTRRVDWLFFLDGDEVALLDRDLLKAIPAEISVVRLFPLESVSDPDIEPSLFKRPLSDADLDRLSELGLLRHPKNSRYFHGHLAGKVGVRPTAPVRFLVHAAVGPDGEDLHTFEHPSLRHLHFESPTFDDFVRKWSALATSGPPPGLRGRRSEILNAFRDMREMPIRAQESRQRELFDHYVREDGPGLYSAGVLELVDLAEVRYQPEPSAPDVMQRLQTEMDRLASLPKRMFLPSAPEAALYRAIDALPQL